MYKELYVLICCAVDWEVLWPNGFKMGPLVQRCGFRFKFRAGLCAVFLGKILYFDSTYFYLGVNMSTGDMSVKFDEMLKWGRG